MIKSQHYITLTRCQAPTVYKHTFIHKHWFLVTPNILYLEHLKKKCTLSLDSGQVN